jgi:hypothetical protein
VSKLPGRKLALESLPADVRAWAADALVTPYNKLNDDLAAILNGGLLLRDNAAMQVLEFTVQVPDDWVALTLTSPWTAFTSTLTVNVPSVRKNANGEVFMRGAVKGGTVPSFAATLPAAYRPDARLICVTDGDDAFARFNIRATGEIEPVIGTAATFFSLDRTWVAADRSPIPAACWPKRLQIDPAIRAPIIGVFPWSIRDTASTPTRLGNVTVDWEYVSGTQGNFVKINNMPGLAPGKKYAVRLAAFAG